MLALRLKQPVYYSDKLSEMKTQESVLKIFIWKSVSLSQNEFISIQQNIKSSCKKIQKVCKKTILSCTRALEYNQQRTEPPISEEESKR